MDVCLGACIPPFTCAWMPGCGCGGVGGWYRGDYGSALQPFAGPGHWHDMDMLLIGNNCVSIEEEHTQMAIWAISVRLLLQPRILTYSTLAPLAPWCSQVS